MDEATSALDSLNETIVYKNCLEMGITLISVAHRESLMEFHDVLLKFDGTGKYTVQDISAEMKEKARLTNKKVCTRKVVKMAMR
jgi:ABC-type uncharacterized transport system fused permease/ATPase subunit